MNVVYLQGGGIQQNSIRNVLPFEFPEVPQFDSEKQSREARCCFVLASCWAACSLHDPVAF